MEEKYIKNRQGYTLYTATWKNTTNKKCVFFLHGITEHCRLYDHIAIYFNNNGYDMFGFDFRVMGEVKEKNYI